MVQLLDLPLEIVDDIMEWWILIAGRKEVAGQKGAVRIRLVSRLLNDRFMAATAVSDSYLYSAWDLRRYSNLALPAYNSVLSPFASRIIARRLASSKPLNDTEILLHGVLRRLEIPAEQYLAALQTLFESAGECVRQNRTFEWWHRCFPLFSFETHSIKATDEASVERHLLPAAILLGVKHFYEPMFDSISNTNSMVNDDSAFCGTPLHAAITAGQHDLVRRIFDLADTPEPKRNLLRAAAVINDEAMLQFLLDRDRELRPSCLQEALNDAAQLGHERITRALIRYASQTQSDILTPEFLAESVYFAARHGKLAVLEILCQNGADLLRTPGHDISDSTPAMLAAWRGDTEMLRWIIQRRFPSGEWDNEAGWGPIWAAIDGDRAESLRILFEAGAAEPLSTWDEETAWYMMMRCWLLRKNKALRYLVLEARVADLCPEDEWINLKYWMAVACKDGNVGMFDVLVESGVSVNAPLDLKDPPGLRGPHPTWTPMHFAMASNEDSAVEIVEKLQNMGVPKIDFPSEGSPSDGFKPRMLPTERRRYSTMPRGLRMN